MKQLELKHLAPYQEHKVKLMYKGSVCNIAYLSTKRIAFIRTDGTGEVIKMMWEKYYKTLKPILRPLSDLIKEIEINGEKFVPIEYFEDNNYAPAGLEFYSDTNTFLFGKELLWQVDEIHYNMVEKLFEWHFDVFGLIPEGLAINYNDIN
jgi:hypothetical protein